MGTRVGQLIKATHHYGYRYGWTNPWGLVVAEGWWPSKERFVYVIKYDDGVVDVWPQVDSSDPYEFQLPGDLISASLSPTGGNSPTNQEK